MNSHSKRTQLSWAFYDWANSAFATTVMAGFFPVFFKAFWAADLSVTDSTFWLGVGNSVASILVVILAPFIGALADQGGHKKKLLILFAFLGILMSASLYIVAAGFWMLALVVYGLGVIGFASSIVCYDALLVDVAPPRQLDRVSAFGFALGYLGGGLLFALNVVMVLKPEMSVKRVAAVRWPDCEPSPSRSPSAGHCVWAYRSRMKRGTRLCMVEHLFSGNGQTFRGPYPGRQVCPSCNHILLTHRAYNRWRSVAVSCSGDIWLPFPSYTRY